MKLKSIVRYSLMLAFIAVANLSFATRLSGVVKDTDGYPVAFAMISVKGTSINTSASEDGAYFIEIPEGSATLEISAFGYKKLFKKINLKGTEQTQNFDLEDESTQMQEVVFTGEDPAYGIMRRVIANKKKNAKEIKTFETDVYLKGKLYLRSIPKTFMGTKLDGETEKELQNTLGLDSTNNGIVYLLEQMTHYYSKYPNKEFNRINAVKTSGDPKGLGFSKMPSIFKIYDNNISVMDELNPRGFISPASDNAFMYYKFKYISTTTVDGVEIDKIIFWPKRKLEPTFRGTLYVAEDDWAFQQVELILDKDAQISAVDTFKIQQQYRKLGKHSWVIQQQIFYPVIKIFGFDFAGNFLTNYTNTKINHNINDSIFRQKIVSIYDSAALDKKLDYWQEKRPIEISNEEERNYVVKDSVNNVLAVKKDSIYNATIYKYGFSDFLVGGANYSKRNNKIGFEPLISTVSFNSVEGFVFGLNPYWNHVTKSKSELNLKMETHYGFAINRFQYLFSGNYTIKDSTFVGKSKVFTLKGGRNVFQIDNQKPISNLLNTYTTLVRGHNYMKLYQAQKLEAEYEQKFGNGFALNAGLNFENREPLNDYTRYTFFEKNEYRFKPNQPPSLLPYFVPHQAFVVSLGVSYQPGWKLIQYPKYKEVQASDAPVFSASYQKGINEFLGSDVDFDKWKIGIKHELNFNLLGTLNYNVIGGGFLNKKYVGLPDMQHFLSNQTAIANYFLNGFQTMPYYTYSSTPNLYSELHMAWHLNGWLTNKIPLFRRLNWNLVMTGNGMITDAPNNFYEYGIGLENIGWKMFRFLRVDFFGGRGTLTPEWRYRFLVGTNIPLGQLF